MTRDPRVISLDIETYGAVSANQNGRSMPSQTVFHPAKSLYIDGVRPQDMVLTVAITLPKEDPRWKMTSQENTVKWNADLLSGLHPGGTIVLEMWKKMHRECLSNWLKYADTIIGMNLQFDILYLRHFDEVFRSLLGPHQTLIDLSVLNYLHSELREEKSLKALGPILGSFSYKETLKNTKFKDPTEPQFQLYNAQDTHNTMLAVSEFASRLSSDFGDTCKASEWCLQFYSDTIWSTISMSEEGIPMSSLMLEDLFKDMETNMEIAAVKAEEYDLILQGEGSAASKDKFIDEVISHISKTNPTILDELEVTEKKKKVSFTKGNRVVLLQNLEDRDPFIWPLYCANSHSEAQKLLSSYCYPLLYHRRNKVDDKSSIIIPPDGPPLPLLQREDAPLFERVADKINACDKRTKALSYKERFGTNRSKNVGDAFGYPTWYVTPSHIKETQGSSGGTIQGRITCKHPSAQTFPPPVKKCIRSRYEGGRILGMDLSQIELRVAALLSGEQSMIRAYNQNKDLHADRARSLWPTYDEEEDDRKNRRQVGKMMNFADLFLSSPDTMKEQVYAQSDGSIDLPVEFFKKVVKDRADIRPQLTDWQLSLLHKAKVTSRIVLPFTGQSRTFIGNLGKSRSEIVNFPVQTTAGNLALCIQNELRAMIKEVWQDLKHRPRIFMQVYDAIYLDTPESEVNTIKTLIESAIDIVCSPKGYWGLLQSHTKNQVPLQYDIEELNAE